MARSHACNPDLISPAPAAPPPGRARSAISQHSPRRSHSVSPAPAGDRARTAPGAPGPGRFSIAARRAPAPPQIAAGWIAPAPRPCNESTANNRESVRPDPPTATPQPCPSDPGTPSPIVPSDGGRSPAAAPATGRRRVSRTRTIRQRGTLPPETSGRFWGIA